MKKQLIFVILALSTLVTFNAQAGDTQSMSCDALASEYVFNASSFDSQYRDFMKNLLESDNPASVSQEIQTSTDDLTDIINSVSVKSCNLVEFVDAIYSDQEFHGNAEVRGFIQDGKLTPRYCDSIHDAKVGVDNYIDIFTQDGDDTQAFVSAIYAQTDGTGNTLSNMFFQFTLMDFVFLYDVDIPLTHETVDNLTETQLETGSLKAQHALAIYQAVSALQEVRKETFCSTE